MSRIAIPTRDAAPAASQPLLDAVEAQLGVVPNLFRLVSISHAALEGHLGLHGALGKTLDLKTRNRIAIATVRLNYPKVAAEAGPCGLWPADLGSTYEIQHFENKPYWNLGCATQRNLAAMVDNPTDLVQPRGESSPYAGRRAVVLDKYRKGEATATTFPNAGQGMISDIGK